MGVEIQINKAFRILLFAVIVFLLFAETSLNAIGSIYIPIQRITILAFLMGFLLVCVFLKRKIRVDLPLTILLFCRFPFYVIISLSDQSLRNAFWSHYLIIIIAPIVFFCIYNLVEKDSIIVLERILKVSIIIIAIQVHSSLLRLFISGHALFQIKQLIGIPLGYSNTIASIALIQAVLSYLLLKNKFFFTISSTSLLCTLSKSAFLVYIVAIFVILFFDSIEKKRLSIFLRYSVLIITILLIANHYLSEYFTVYTKAIDSLLSNDLESINNGRSVIFEGYMNDIALKPVLGWGIGKYNSIDGMAHNLFLQSMFSGGIVGTLIYYLPLIVIVVKSFHWDDKLIRIALFALILSSIAHGSVENFFFTVPCEFFFWLYITLLYKEGIKNGQNGMRNS